LSSQPAYQTGSSCGCSVGRQIATAPWNAEIRHEEARRVPVQMPKSWFQVIVHGSRFQELQYSTAQQTGPEQPDTSTASCLFLSAAFPAKAAFSAASVPTAAAPAASPQFCHMTEGWRDRLDITASRAAYMRRRRSPVQMPAVRLTCLSSRAAGTYAEAGTAAGSAAPHAGMSGRRMLGAQQASAQSLCAMWLPLAGRRVLPLALLLSWLAASRAGHCRQPPSPLLPRMTGGDCGLLRLCRAQQRAHQQQQQRLALAAAAGCTAAVACPSCLRAVASDELSKCKCKCNKLDRGKCFLAYGAS